MIVALASAPFGTMISTMSLVSSLVARQLISVTLPACRGSASY
jgi:hypothetical protein